LRTFSLRHLIIMAILCCLIFVQTSGTALGSFTIEDEKKIGQEFYEKMEKANVLLRNPKINDYITKLGNKVLASSQKAPFDFHFSVIKSSAVNAFATPGGYIYVNRGLINLVDNEAELAGVIAHEIAHVNGRHIAQIVEKATKVNIAALAGMLAAAFLGGGGDLGAAAMGFSLATATTLTLKYSREHEEEADRIGLETLVAAGYNPQGMPDFMKLMKRYEFYSNSVPSYFLTHPGTDERIRYLDALLQTTYKQKGKDNILGGLKRIQTILLFGSTNLNSSLQHFTEGLGHNPRDIDDLYGAAVTYYKLGQADRALEFFQKAINIVPGDEDVLRDMGVVLFKLGRPAEAVPVLRKALDIDPADEDAIQYLGRSYGAVEDYASALALYKKIEDKPIDDADLYYNIAMAYGKTNHPGEMHYFFGLHFQKTKKTESALYHLRAAIPFFPKGSKKADDIEVAIKSLTAKPDGKEVPKKK
jgi:beta-barrel assembly-enhancing protease